MPPHKTPIKLHFTVPGSKEVRKKIQTQWARDIGVLQGLGAIFGQGGRGRIRVGGSKKIPWIFPRAKDGLGTGVEGTPRINVEASTLGGGDTCRDSAGGGTGKRKGIVGSSLGQKATGNGHLGKQLSGGSTTGLLAKGGINGQVGSRCDAVEAK